MTNGNRGWIAVNHGPAFASALSRYLEEQRRTDLGQRGESEHERVPQ